MKISLTLITLLVACVAQIRASYPTKVIVIPKFDNKISPPEVCNPKDEDLLKGYFKTAFELQTTTNTDFITNKTNTFGETTSIEKCLPAEKIDELDTLLTDISKTVSAGCREALLTTGSLECQLIYMDESEKALQALKKKEEKAKIMSGIPGGYCTAYCNYFCWIITEPCWCHLVDPTCTCCNCYC